MPGFFRSQLGNKVWYTGIGAPDLLRRSCADLHLKLRLECDGVEVALPPDAEGLVITNIPCHMGGVYLWETGLPAPPIALPPGASPDCQAAAANLTTNRRQALADGLIEVVALGGVAHLGRLSLGLARAQRLCQCRSVALTTLTTLPMQVDGEPWLQEPAQLQLQHCSTALMLRRRAGDPAQRVAAVVLEVLEASEAHGHITAAQRAALQREMAAALELL
ncbi:diacylglycerol kinase accessory domain-containing protein [Haematococcus lacustris]